MASYLHARQNGGEWLVRIEDIDPPREVPGAADQILRVLEAFELDWDREVLYQSSRLIQYDEVAQRLLAQGLAFRCRCTRSELRTEPDAPPGRYPGTCRDRTIPPGDAAVRVQVDLGNITVTDGLQGTTQSDLGAVTGDYVIVRRDGLPAYHLAVVLDDAAQGVTTVVRGVDLLESTATHIHLQRTLELASPRYYHLPVIVNEFRQKLSKQTGAAPIEATQAGVAAKVLELMGLPVPAAFAGERPRALWRWALENWSIERLRGRREISALAGS